MDPFLALNLPQYAPDRMSPSYIDVWHQIDLEFLNILFMSDEKAAEIRRQQPPPPHFAEFAPTDHPLFPRGRPTLAPRHRLRAAA
jgi:hypothetical protein